MRGHGKQVCVEAMLSMQVWIQDAFLLGYTSMNISINLSNSRNTSVKWGNKTYMWIWWVLMTIKHLAYNRCSINGNRLMISWLTYVGKMSWRLLQRCVFLTFKAVFSWLCFVLQHKDLLPALFEPVRRDPIS